MCIYIYIYIHTYIYIYAHLFEPRRFVASDYSENVPRRVCGHFLKPC